MAKVKEITKEMLLSNGDYPAFAWPGGYNLYYFAESTGQIFCSECASQEDANPEITDYDIHWEGEPLYCDGCGKEIESSYGIPD